MDFFLQILLHSLVFGTQILLVAVPLYLVYAVSRVLHLAVGAMGTLTAYMFFAGLTWSGNFFVATLCAIISVIVCAVISQFMLDAMIRKNQTVLALLISFSFGVLIESLIAIFFGSGGKAILTDVLPTVTFGNVYLTLPGLCTLGGGILLTLLTTGVLLGTPLGRQLRSISENSLVTESIGITSQKLRLFAYMLAIFLAGIISILTGMETALVPMMGFNTIVLAFMAFLMGGVTDIRGTIVSSYILAIIPQLILSFTSVTPSWKMVLVFLIATFFLLLRPNGLFTSKLRSS